MKGKKLDDASHVRRLLSFTCFATTSFPNLSKKPTKPWDFEIVRKAFSDWVNVSQSEEGRNRAIIKISEEIEAVEPGGDEFVWYKVDKNRFAGIIILYSIVGFYKMRNGKKDNSEGNFPDQEILDEINLTYYWHKEVMSYYTKILELKNMSDENFRKLPAFDIWLNTK